MTIEIFQTAEDKITVIIEGERSVAAFKELVQRGTNLWPDAIPEIKRAADLVTVGHVQQDYESQDTSKSAPKKLT